MTRSRRLDDLRHATEREIAPHVDPVWTEAALLELRLRGVSGDQIGSVLAEVDAHCADSGQSAAEAFGNPVQYARGLELPVNDLSPQELARTAAPVLVQVAGLLVGTWGLGAWLDGVPLDLTVGLVAVGASLVAAVAVLLRHPDPVLRFVVDRSVVVVGLVASGTITAQVALSLLLDGVIASVPAQPVALVGLMLVVGGQVAVLRDPGRIDDDPVTHPLADPTAPSVASPSGRHALRLVEVGTRWSMSLAALVLGALTWLVSTVS